MGYFPNHTRKERANNFKIVFPQKTCHKPCILTKEEVDGNKETSGFFETKNPPGATRLQEGETNI
jgi:hypothetical protein